MFNKAILFTLPIAFAASAPAIGQINSTTDPAPGAASLISSDYASAEKEIRAANVSEFDPARSINLGIALAKQGNQAKAAELFRSVLSQDDVEMVVANGNTVMSHDLARTALASLERGGVLQPQ